MAEFGGGIALTQDLDIELNEAGDTRTVIGQTELEKDLALQSIIQLSDLLGQRDLPSMRADLKAGVRTVLTNDPRIQTITQIDVIFTGDDVEIVTEVTTDDGEQELVLSLDE